MAIRNNNNGKHAITRFRVNNQYKFIIDGTIINAELPDSELTKLVYDLFKIAPPISITMENLPVEDTMRTFFSEPEKFLK